MFLLDTNVVSELRRRQGPDPQVLAWSQAQPVDTLFLSVVSILEIEQGILLVGVINWGVGALLGLTGGFAAEANPLKLNLGLLEALTVAGSFALGILTMAAVLKFVLPTKPMRAVGVSVCHSA